MSTKPSQEFVRCLLVALISASLVICWYEFRKTKSSTSSQPDSLPKVTLVPVVYCVRDVPPDGTVQSEDVEEKLIDLKTLPANVLPNRWIAIGRVSKYGLTKGRMVHFEDFGLAPKINLDVHN